MSRGRVRDMGLGRFRDVTLAEARKKVTELRLLRSQGVDPVEARKARYVEEKLEAARALTFRECAGQYIATHAPSWKNAKHAAQWPSSLEAYVFPILGDVPVQNVDTALVPKTLQPIWANKITTAGRIRGRIESILDWATARGSRKGENPARWRGHLQNLLPLHSNPTEVQEFINLITDYYLRSPLTDKEYRVPSKYPN